VYDFSYCCGAGVVGCVGGVGVDVPVGDEEEPKPPELELDPLEPNALLPNPPV